MDELLMKEGIVRGAPVGLGRPLPAGKMQRTPSGNSRTMRPESFVGFIGHRHRAKLASLGALQLHRRELQIPRSIRDRQERPTLNTLGNSLPGLSRSK